MGMDWMSLRTFWMGEGFSTICAGALAREDCSTPEDMAQRGYQFWASTPNVGKKSIQEIHDYLWSKGLRLAGLNEHIELREQTRKRLYNSVWEMALEQAARLVEGESQPEDLANAIRTLPFGCTVTVE